MSLLSLVSSRLVWTAYKPTAVCRQAGGHGAAEKWMRSCLQRPAPFPHAQEIQTRSCSTTVVTSVEAAKRRANRMGDFGKMRAG